ncbi:glyoxalase [Bacillus glycinifermentans]|nr:glyoxalase [Bacillus glycinifermentans]
MAMDLKHRKIWNENYKDSEENTHALMSEVRT